MLADVRPVTNVDQGCSDRYSSCDVRGAQVPASRSRARLGIRPAAMSSSSNFESAASSPIASTRPTLREATGPRFVVSPAGSSAQREDGA